MVVGLAYTVGLSFEDGKYRINIILYYGGFTRNVFGIGNFVSRSN